MTENQHYWVNGAFNQLVDDYLMLCQTKPENLKHERSLRSETEWILHKLMGWSVKYVELNQLNITTI
jgi:hypothetical protein